MTSSFSVISSYADKEKRATAFALVSTLGYVGAIIGPIAGGVLASLYGLFLPFLLAIPLVLVSVILIMFKLEKGEITSTRAVPSLMEVKKGVTIERGVMVLIFLVILSQFFMEFGNPYYSIFLKSELKAPEYIIGITESMLSVGALVIALPGGYLSDILHKRKPFLILGSLFATTGVGLTAFATNALMVTATYFLFGLSNTLFMTSLQAYFADVAGKYKSIVFGVYQSVAWLAGIPAPLIAGSIAQNYGLRAPFMVNFIGSLTGLLLLSTLFAEKTTKS
jgi:DHA1 family multidrug resistance protein-like MFS transporter